jgi:hypothetical protein
MIKLINLQNFQEITETNQPENLPVLAMWVHELDENGNPSTYEVKQYPQQQEVEPV